MKQILIIISLFCCIGMSAQDITPLDKIFDEISAIKSYRNDAKQKNIVDLVVVLPRNDSKQKINHGDGVVVYVHNDLIGKHFLCSKECNSYDYFEGMTTEDAEQANARNGKIFDAILKAVGNNLDSLMQISEESYHYESHVDGNDTIIYSICIKNGEDTAKAIKAYDGSMIFPNALETVSLNFTTRKKECGKHVSGYGIISYNKNVYLPDRKSYYFEKEPYLKKIIPLLKQKGIKSWKFTWAQSADYDFRANIGKELLWGESVRFVNGKESNEGHTTGTMYFIPHEKKELAEAIFTSIDSITLAHTDLHPEQIFTYAYNVPESILQNENRNNITQLFEGRTGEGHVSTRIMLGSSPQGYYVAVLDATNSLFVSQEWYKLKSFVDGKKKYVH